MMDYEKLTNTIQIPALGRTCFCSAEFSGGSSVCTSPASLNYIGCNSPLNASRQQQSLHGMFSPLFLDGESSPLLSASYAKSSEGCFFPCMDALSTIKRFGVLSADPSLDNSANYEPGYGKVSSPSQQFSGEHLKKDVSKCAQYNFPPPPANEFVLPPADACSFGNEKQASRANPAAPTMPAMRRTESPPSAHHQNSPVENAYCKLSLNVAPSRPDSHLTEDCELSAQKLANQTLSSQPTEIAIGSAEKQIKRCSEASLPVSKKAPENLENPANMVLSQRPVPMRSSYYGDYPRTFEESYASYHQSFGARQPVSQFQAAPQFNSFNSNGKPCYNNAFQRFGRNCYQIEPKTGMRDVPLWLKSLRLHKYTPLLAAMSYDEMMRLDEDRLEYLGVTKGARKKIMQSIEKLRERVSLLRNMEKAIDEGKDYGNLTCLIAELRGTMNTPIRIYPAPESPRRKNISRAQIEGFDILPDRLDEENLPGHLIRIIGKVQAILVGPNAPTLSDDCYAWLMQTFDRIAVHEAFTTAQKVRAASWKRSFKKICSPSVTRRNMRKPNASVLLASGNGNNNNSQSNGNVSHASQQSPNTENTQRKRCEQQQQPTSRKNSQAGYPTPNMQLVQQPRQLPPAPIISQTIFQNALNAVIQAFSSSATISQQTAAYYLGVASVTAALSSPDMVEKLREILSSGNASPQALNQLQKDVAAHLLKHPGCCPNGLQYAQPSCYIQPAYPRNGPTLENTYNNNDLNGAQTSHRSMWPPYLGVEEHRQAPVLSSALPSLSESYCSRVPSNDSFSTSKLSNVSSGSQASTSAYSPPRNVMPPQPSSVAYPVNVRSCSQPVNGITPSNLPRSSVASCQFRQPSNNMFMDITSLRPETLDTRHSMSSTREDLLQSAWYDVPSTSSLKISPTESLFESISTLGTEHSSLRMAEPRKQMKKLCNDGSSLFGAALPTRPAAGSPSEQLNSLSPSPGCSSNASERGSGAGSPPGLLVYNFVNEGSSGELDSACRNAALEENH